MTTVIKPYPSQQVGNCERVKDEALRAIGFAPSDPWGHLWVYQGEIYILGPWKEPDDLSEHAIAFLDESYDEGSRTLVYGGLGFLPFPLMIATAQFIADLLVLREVYPGVWPSSVRPSRLHLRELYPHAARQKTLWRHLSKDHLDYLVKAALSSAVCNSAFRFVFPVDQNNLKRAIDLNASDLCGTENVPDLSIQAAAILLRLFSVHTLGDMMGDVGKYCN